MLVVHDITASSYKEKQCLFPSTSRTIKNQQKGEIHPDKSQGNGTGQRKPRQLHRQGQITVVLLGLDLGWGGVCLANRTPSKKYLLNEWYYGARGLPTQKNWGNG